MGRGKRGAHKSGTSSDGTQDSRSEFQQPKKPRPSSRGSNCAVLSFAGGTSDESLRSRAGSEEGRVDTSQGVDRGRLALSAERTPGPERGEKDGSVGSRQSRWPSIALRAPAQKGRGGSARLKPPAQKQSCAVERLAACWPEAFERHVKWQRIFFLPVGASNAVFWFQLVV
ncbi:hypothetical protein HPB51_012878 [Rhipicephalus microplus]|uniref:Uncharacterized protein n=1 Tax=Rhipicephalus microplus TaxID=6941 RepID=A0A9J6DV24_RHIMP|nr:hypothetical protein HPB51_012878 [Rhipicephalus microplus]